MGLWLLTILLAQYNYESPNIMVETTQVERNTHAVHFKYEMKLSFIIHTLDFREEGLSHS